MNNDPELEAITKVVAALSPLDDAARERVLKYSIARFKTLAPSAVADLSMDETVPKQNIETGSEAEKTITSFGQLAELYHAAQPSTETEKALVVSAWMQESEGKEGIDSYSVNTALKHLGYPIGNITRALDALVNQRPALMIQLRKGGTSKQARKLFKVTDAGTKKIAEMLRMSVR